MRLCDGGRGEGGRGDGEEERVEGEMVRRRGWGVMVRRGGKE